MRTYIYDKTFKGFLSAAALALKTAGPALITSDRGFEADLFTELTETETDPAGAAGLFRRIGARGSSASRRHIWRAFLSEAEGAETALFEYIRLILKKGPAADDMLADDRVKRVHDLSGKTAGEAERFKGFARFKELADKTLYARIEPGHNILPLIAPHFAARLGPFNWVLHDAGRCTAALHTGGKLSYAAVDAVNIRETDNEISLQKLWKQFFKAVAIQERLNPKLQRQFVPLKYRKNLTEFDP